MDDSRFPHMARYLGSLPEGLDSYPECQSKGSLLKSTLDSQRFHEAWLDLPAPVLRLITHPPLPTEWVSAVATDCVFYAVVDAYYPKADAMLAWIHASALRLARSPMYRLLTKVSGFKNFLRGATKIQGLFQRGTDLDVAFDGDGAEVTLSHPAHLHSGFKHLSNEATFSAILLAVGAVEASAEMTESTPHHAKFHVRWRA